LLKARSSDNPEGFRRATVLTVKYLYTYLTMMVPMLSLQESYYGQTARLIEFMDLLKVLLFHSDRYNGLSIGSKSSCPIGYDHVSVPISSFAARSNQAASGISGKKRAG
jgi:hypothetical protein